MTFVAYGQVNAYHDGQKQEVQMLNTSPGGLQEFAVKIKNPTKAISNICFEVVHEPGEYAGSAFPEPVKLTCGKGMIKTGDWSEMGVLKAYSGGMWYRKSVKVNKKMLDHDVFLDLGEVCATAEVHINGKPAGILMTKPFRLDISDYLQEGRNYFEILVYSTLANHYSTIPTPKRYKQSFEAGLIGPVKIVSQ
jgi:hypothetical protein